MHEPVSAGTSTADNPNDNDGGQAGDVDANIELNPNAKITSDSLSSIQGCQLPMEKNLDTIEVDL